MENYSGWDLVPPSLWHTFALPFSYNIAPFYWETGFRGRLARDLIVMLKEHPVAH